ncbi:hypothetical protein J6590_060038 [Homalodisca vitripennis]|nr:hypothetical protein J6590_060038 [Homalodisca vitripennis]
MSGSENSSPGDIESQKLVMEIQLAVAWIIVSRYLTVICEDAFSANDLVSCIHLKNFNVFIPASKVEITGVAYIEPEITEQEVISESNNEISLIKEDQHLAEKFMKHIVPNHVPQDEAISTPKIKDRDHILEENFTMTELIAVLKTKKKDTAPGNDPISYSMITHLPEEALRTALTDINNFFNDISLSLSVNKCKAMVLYRKKRINDVVNLEAEGQQLPIESRVKMLGITIDNQLEFDEHINNLTNQCSKDLNTIKMITCGRNSVNPH